MDVSKSQSYGSDYQKLYPNYVGLPNNFNNGGDIGSGQSLKLSIITLLFNWLGNHEAILRKLSKQIVTMKTEINGMQGRTRYVERKLGKIVDSQWPILAKFAGKPKPHPVILRWWEVVWMMKICLKS
jgi:hypothetical protein